MKSFLSLLALLLICLSASLCAQEPATPMRIRVSAGVSQGLLLKTVQPVYPADARANHIEGLVVMQATISTIGDIKNLRLVSGDPVLATAAIEAVRQWKYKPYLLNGQPVEVETQVTVAFQLAKE